MSKLMSLMLAGIFALSLGAGTANASAAPAKIAGSLHVYDDGKLFSPDGIKRAQGLLGDVTFEGGQDVTIDSRQEPPGDKKKEAESIAKDQAKLDAFMIRWAKEEAKSDRAKGIYILICRHPGAVAVIASDRTRQRGFSHDDELKVRDILISGFRKAASEPEDKRTETRDAALRDAVSFIVSDLSGTHVTTGTKSETEQKKAGGFMSGIGGWICIGLCVMLGIWLVVGIFRALTGGGGGGGGYGGGGYGGGGGGGGFFSSMLGGLFGAAAGMYLYNNMFGGGGMFGGGSDAYANDGATGDTGPSDSDFSGDQGAAGGYDDAGGGDYGGDAGGDYGGGGDFGGGDFGGGDF